MVDVTFIRQSAPNIRRKLQRLDRVLGMNLPSGGHSLYNLPCPGNKDIEAGHCFLRNSAGKPKGEAGPEGKEERPTRSQSMYLYKQEGPWREDCSRLKRKTSKDRNPR